MLDRYMGNICHKQLYSAFMKKKNIKIAAITFIHTHSRNGEYKPHIHIILGEGALDVDDEKWLTLYKHLCKMQRWFTTNTGYVLGIS